MRACILRVGVLLHCRDRLHLITTLCITIISAAVILTGTALVRAGDKDRTERVDTEHLFGFVEGADIGGKGEAEAMIDTSLRSGKSAGTFVDTASELELKYSRKLSHFARHNHRLLRHCQSARNCRCPSSCGPGAVR